MLEIYFGQFILQRRYKDFSAQQWKSRRISLEEFIELVLFACFFLKYKPSKEDLTEIFITLDTDKDGYISFSEYLAFIIKYLGIGLDMYKEEPKPVEPVNDKPSTDKPAEITEDEWGFISEIWDELKIYFDKYDSGSKGYLNTEDLRRFVIEVLHENIQRELDYIFWNLFRVDPNTDRKFEFNEFVIINLYLGTIHFGSRWRNRPSEIPQRASERKDHFGRR